MDLDTSKEQVSFDNKDAKRIKKTPEQIEMLAKVYAENNHPSEAVRMQLSAELGLTNRQLQMWFCNRRLKERKGQKAERGSMSLEENGDQKRVRPKDSSESNEYPPAVLASEIEDAAIFGRNGFKPPVQQTGEKRVRKSKNQEVPPEPQKKGSQQVSQKVDLQTAADFAAFTTSESWQGEPYREDGPALGFEFDSIPPGAFDMPIEKPVAHRTFVAVPHQDDDMEYILPDMKPLICEKKLDLKNSTQKLKKASDKKREQKAKQPNQRQLDGERSKRGDRNISKVQASREKEAHTVHSGNGFVGRLPTSKLSALSSNGHRVNSIEFKPPYVEQHPKLGYETHIDGHVGNGGRDPRSSEELSNSSDDSDDAKYFVEDLRGKESSDKLVGEKDLDTKEDNEEYTGYYYNRGGSAENTIDTFSEESS